MREPALHCFDRPPGGSAGTPGMPRTSGRRSDPHSYAGLPMSADALRAAVYAKGWRLNALAAHWGLSAGGLSRIVHNPARARYWDDAVCGLPRIGKPVATPAGAVRQPNAAHLAKRSKRQRVKACADPAGYEADLVAGAVLSLTKAFGSLGEEGERAIVVARCHAAAPSALDPPDAGRGVVRSDKQGNDRSLAFGLVFEGGGFEWVSARQIDEYLAFSGLVRDALAAYRFVDAQQVQQDHAAGRFVFW
jgi:hypothetical protein